MDSIACFFIWLFNGKSPYDITMALIQLCGVILLLFYTIETYRMRKCNDIESKRSEDRHIASVRPILSVYSKDDGPNRCGNPIGMNEFVITNFGNGVAFDVEIFAFNSEADICSLYESGFQYIGGKESRLIDRLTTRNLDEVKEGIGKKFGNESLKFISGIKNTPNTRYIIAICRDVYGNIYAMQRDMTLDVNGHRVYMNGDEKRTLLTS